LVGLISSERKISAYASRFDEKGFVFFLFFMSQFFDWFKESENISENKG
jgi:hypothetical protein